MDRSASKTYCDAGKVQLLQVPAIDCSLVKKWKVPVGSSVASHLEDLQCLELPQAVSNDVRLYDALVIRSIKILQSQRLAAEASPQL